MQSLNRFLTSALAVGVIGLAFSAQAAADCGTALEFVDSPAEAAKKALEEEKLVFILHVSGHFETPEYT